MAAFDSIIKDILPYVPNCPDSLIESTLRSACIEFAERSKAYVFDLEPITTISGVYEYEFDQPSGTEVHQILWMTYDGNLLGSHAANMATYALYIQVIFLLNNFYADLHTPLDVFRKYFSFFSTFDWER